MRENSVRCGFCQNFRSGVQSAVSKCCVRCGAVWFRNEQRKALRLFKDRPIFMFQPNGDSEAFVEPWEQFSFPFANLHVLFLRHHAVMQDPLLMEKSIPLGGGHT